MAWRWLDRLLGRGGQSDKRSSLPEIPWIDAASNPWRVPLLDVRPVTQGMLSASKDARCAENLNSLARDDGTCFVGVMPDNARRIAVQLKYRIDKTLADGILFAPQAMEHKWAIYFHRERIILVRSWTRQVVAVADARIAGTSLEIHSLCGTLIADDEEADDSIRVLDYLVRSHVMNSVYPVPLMRGMEQAPSAAAMWCMSCFGNVAAFATPHPLPFDAPEEVLRTDSLLHIAAARGNLDQLKAQLALGVPADILARDGLTPLQWALAQDDDQVWKLLIERGSVDVRTDEGATPLMSAVQARELRKATYLLDHGADPNAADARGFTALHRAAEMGEKELVRLLLARGAAPHPQAQGHTPSSLAEARGEQEIVALLKSR